MPYFHNYCKKEVKLFPGDHVAKCSHCGSMVLMQECEYVKFDVPTPAEPTFRVVATDYVHTCGSEVYIACLHTNGVFDSVWCVSCGQIGKKAR